MKVYVGRVRLGCVVLGDWVGMGWVAVGGCGCVGVCCREFVLLLDVFAGRRLLLLYSSSDQHGLNEQGLAQARKIQP